MENNPNITEKLIALQGEMKPVMKDRDNPFFKSNYATLLAIVNMLRPLLAKYKVGYTQSVRNHDDKDWMETRIVDEAGSTIVSEVPFTCSSSKPQDIGSAITYMKRYGLQCAFGVVVEDDETDDDGNRASGNFTQKAVKPNKPAVAKVESPF